MGTSVGYILTPICQAQLGVTHSSSGILTDKHSQAQLENEGKWSYFTASQLGNEEIGEHSSLVGSILI